MTKCMCTVKPVLSDTLKRECKKGAVKGRLIQDKQEIHDSVVKGNVLKHRMSLNTGVGPNRFNCTRNLNGEIVSKRGALKLRFYC